MKEWWPLGLPDIVGGDHEYHSSEYHHPFVKTVITIGQSDYESIAIVTQAGLVVAGAILKGVMKYITYLGGVMEQIANGLGSLRVVTTNGKRTIKTKERSAGQNTSDTFM
ncbi:hypothetical protein AB6A40_008499 [Gnathostoma spinigerum]|uniref:Uncharacterized protein n=1 Tax=Gnathostoma spinigerum TaxID=75299 RepID=A0ABD6EQI2_9BILA